MVTYDGNGTNITKEALMAKFKKAKADLRDEGKDDLWDGTLAINASWRGY